MITVFTPAYNRSKLLCRLYNSLLKQSDKSFEWVVVDDGSADDTKNVIENWINENSIKIKYIYQNNQGKHVAFNNGVNNAEGELFFCVDSDDYLPENAIENVIQTWDKYKNDNTAGIIALKSDTNQKLLGKKMPDGVLYSTAYDLMREYNCGGERSLIYRTDILKENTYPVIEGEKFISECVVYDRIDMKYKMILLNEILTICEYQPDGLTNNFFNIMLKNPTGFKIYYIQRIEMAKTHKERISYIIRYNAFKTLSSDKQYNYKGKHNIQVFLLKPLGWLAAIYYRRKKIQ